MNVVQLELRFKIKHGYNKFLFNHYQNLVGIALQNQARLQPENCVVIDNPPLELRFKIKHGYNSLMYKVTMILVGIALQNQARLQRSILLASFALSWNCASKSSTVTTEEGILTLHSRLELRFKIKHGYNGYSSFLF